MTNTTLPTLSDAELKQLIASAEAEIASRDRRRKEETIAKIRALAGDIGVSVSIAGARGRPAKGGSHRPAKSAGGR